MLQKIISKTCTWARINGARVDVLTGQGKVIFFQRLKKTINSDPKPAGPGQEGTDRQTTRCAPLPSLAHLIYLFTWQLLLLQVLLRPQTLRSF